jgi:hypothetical protein
MNMAHLWMMYLLNMVMFKMWYTVYPQTLINQWIYGYHIFRQTQFLDLQVPPKIVKHNTKTLDMIGCYIYICSNEKTQFQFKKSHKSQEVAKLLFDLYIMEVNWCQKAIFKCSALTQDLCVPRPTQNIRMLPCFIICWHILTRNQPIFQGIVVWGWQLGLPQNHESWDSKPPMDRGFRFNLPDGSSAFQYWRLYFHETFGAGGTVYKVHVAEVGRCLSFGVDIDLQRGPPKHWKPL